MVTPNVNRCAALTRLAAINSKTDISFPFAYVDFGEASCDQNINKWTRWLLRVMHQKPIVESYNGGFANETKPPPPTMLIGQKTSFSHDIIGVTTYKGRSMLYAHLADSNTPIWPDVQAFLEECGKPIPFLETPCPFNTKLAVDVVYASFNPVLPSPHLQIRKRKLNGEIEKYQPDTWEVVWQPPADFQYAVFVPNLLVALTDAFENEEGEGETLTDYLLALTNASQEYLKRVGRIRYLQYLTVVQRSIADEPNRTELLIPFAEAYKALVDDQLILEELGIAHGHEYSQLARKDAWLKAVGKAEKVLRESPVDLGLPSRKPGC